MLIICNIQQSERIKIWNINKFKVLFWHFLSNHKSETDSEYKKKNTKENTEIKFGFRHYENTDRNSDSVNNILWLRPDSVRTLKILLKIETCREICI